MKRLIAFSLLLAVFSCKAQQIFPLNTFTDKVSPNGYVKDLNNDLNPLVGTYKSTYQNNEIIIYISKVEHKLEERTQKIYYTDALVVKYIVKDTNGIILKSTLNESSIRLYSNKIIQDTAVFYYLGTNCNVGNGKIYIKNISSSQISWDYRPNSMLLDSHNCPGNQDVKVYLPVTKDLIFTKQ